MTNRILAFLLPIALSVPAVADTAPPLPAQDMELAQLTIRERIIVRVPRLIRGTVQPVVQPQVTWREKDGPRCVAVGDLAGALITQPGAVDLVMLGGERIRAKLDGECRPLDFYSGFYIKSSPDGKACAARDTIRARSGATCPIARFRKLKAEPAKR